MVDDVADDDLLGGLLNDSYHDVFDKAMKAIDKKEEDKPGEKGKPGCYAPGHLAHIFLSFLVRYVLIWSPDFLHDRLPVHQSHLARNSIVPSFCTSSIVLPLW